MKYARNCSFDKFALRLFTKWLGLSCSLFYLGTFLEPSTGFEHSLSGSVTKWWWLSTVASAERTTQLGKHSLSRKVWPWRAAASHTQLLLCWHWSLTFSLAVRQLWPFDQTHKCIFMCEYMEVFTCALTCCPPFMEEVSRLLRKHALGLLGTTKGRVSNQPSCRNRDLRHTPSSVCTRSQGW